MDARQQKAEDLAARAAITKGNGYYLVPSQTDGTRHKVVINTLFPTCSCKDFELRNKPCKHILAVRLWLERQAASANADQPAVDNREPSPKVKRPTYRQDWPNYNLAQNREKNHVQDLLADLCRGIPEPPPKGGSKGGRPPVPLRDQAFAACFKVYCGMSARRFMCDLQESHRRGHLTQAMCHNSVIKAMDSPALTPILADLIRVSSLPLAAVETRFAVDSSGFCTSRFIRYYDVKYGVTREKAEWVKVHITTGVQTNVVTAVKILGRDAADVSQLPDLVRATAQGFTVKEVSADMAYAATANFQTVEDVGGTLYAPFKSKTTGAIGGIFEKAFHYFCLHREEFLAHYHLRSNVESTFSAVKRKHGDSVRSKTDTAMTNEALCKLLAHNLCCLVSAMYELGIVPAFWQDEDDGPRDVLRFVRPG